MCCIDCTAINIGPCAPPPPATDADTPLTWGEAVERAAEFSRLLGCEVTADDVLSADADWLDRYGRRIGDVCDDYFDAAVLDSAPIPTYPCAVG
jgi:hypothetical protein